MRKRQTFLLTVLTPESGSPSFCGQIKVIASGKTCNFTSLEDLYRLIALETSEDLLHLGALDQLDPVDYGKKQVE